jgi:hypothetical protein
VGDLVKAQLLGCLLAFHVSNHNHQLFVESSYIVAVRPNGHKHGTHLSAHARAVLYTSVGNFAVTETGQAVTKMIEDCQMDKPR